MHTRLVFLFILALVFHTNSFAQTAGDTLLTARSPLQGAMVADLSPKLATELGLDPQRKGVVITNVAGGSAAQAVGFQRGDVILSLNQKISDVADLERMTNSDSLLWRVAIERRGQQISVVFTDERKNAQQEATIQRERARDQEGAMTQTPSSQSSTSPSHQISPVIAQRNPEYRPNLGIRVQQVTDDIARTFGMTEARGVLVRGIDEKGPARSAGFEIGDLILKIDGQDVTDLDDLQRIITKAGVGKDVSVIIIRMGKEQAKTVRIGSVASLRTPACEDFYPLSESNSPSLREQLFAKRFDDMSSGEIDQAIGIISRCKEAVKTWPQSKLRTWTEAMLTGVNYTLGSIKPQQLARERRVRDADVAALRPQLEAERQATETRREEERKAARLRAKAEEYRQQCPQKLVAMLDELRGLGTDEQSVKRFRELDREHQALIQEMPPDVVAALSALNDSFVAEYASRNVAVSEAEEQLRQLREAAAEKSRQEAEAVAEKRRQEVEAENKQREVEQKMAEQLQQLQMLYPYYMGLQVCAERFSEFNNARSGLKDVLKNKEAGLPREQVERIWNATAEKFKQLEAVLKVNGDAQLYTTCQQNSEYVAGLILLVPGLGGASQDAPLRKKDF